MEQGQVPWTPIGVIATVVATVVGVLVWYKVEPPGIKMENLWTSTNFIVACVVLAWVAVAFDLYDRRKYGQPIKTDKWKNYPFTQVKEKAFKGETVKLDGNEYKGCRFDDVTFEYQGTAPFRVISSQITATKFGARTVILQTSNPVVQYTQQFVHDLYTVTGHPK